jgi:hypothetical protein
VNIFVLDRDPKKCATYHNNSHVVKMITESAQMLSTAVRISGIDIGYRITHINHPCTVWVRKSKSNWLWLREMVEHLHDEWKYRYDHTNNHKAYDIILTLPIPNLPDIGLTSFALAMPEIYRTDDPVESYRQFYIHDKSHLAKWKKRDIPEWFHTKIKNLS